MRLLRRLLFNLKDGLRSNIIKLNVIFAILLAFNYLFSNYFIHRKKVGAKFVNKSIEQELLLQNYVKSFFYFMATGEIDDVLDIVKKYEENNKYLTNKSSKDLKEKLIGINSNWEILKKKASSLVLSRSEQSSEKIKESYKNVLQQLTQLASLQKSLSDTYRDNSNLNYFFIYASQLSISLLMIIIFLLCIRFIDKNFIKKVLKNFTLINSRSLHIESDVDSIIQKSLTLEAVNKKISNSTDSVLESLIDYTDLANKSTDMTVATTKLMNDCQKSTKNGHEKVYQIDQTITEIIDSNDSLVANLKNGYEKLNNNIKSLENIDALTENILEIVKKTKILSVNSSIEAAKAGEYGKGFLVIAEQIKNLAETSGEQSNQISNVLQTNIDQIKSTITENINQFEKSVKLSNVSTNKGAENAKLCKIAFNDIEKKMNTCLIQFDALGEVNKYQMQAMGNIKHVVEEMQSTEGHDNYEKVSKNVLNSLSEVKNSVKDLVLSVNEFGVLVHGNESKQTLN